MSTGWEKRGLVYAPPGAGNLRSHAMLPTPFLMADRIRVFFAACDDLLRGRIFFVDLDRDDPRRIIGRHHQPVLDLGPPGSFDEHGVNPSQIIVRDGKLLLYYIGWQRISETVPYTLFAGVCTSDDSGLSFHRQGTGQILFPVPTERCFRTAPFVFGSSENLEMLYIGGDTFVADRNGKLLPIYSLRRSQSSDGYRWDELPSATILSPNRSRGEIGFGRPVLWGEAGRASLLISLRTESGYQLRRFVCDENGLRSDVVLPEEKQEWESSMTCFGALCAADGWEYLFYNGNQFGRTGFGLARREIGPKFERHSITELLASLACTDALR